MIRLVSAVTPILSICIPVFNHADRLVMQLESLRSLSKRQGDIEMVFVDDASTDDPSVAFDAFQRAGWKVVSARQEVNRGRAAALARAIRMASGSFTLIMDADDTYVADGLERALDELHGLELTKSEAGNSPHGIVCGVVADADGAARTILPPYGLECTLLQLRAEHSISGDLKEIVRTELLVGALCPLFERERRVPTSLLWARISALGRVRCVPTILCNKFYLQGGMTKSIQSYRRGSIAPLLELYGTVARSRAYRSWMYRLRAVTNYHRFLAWQGGPLSRFMTGALGVAGIPGFLLGTCEIKMARMRGDRRPKTIVS